MVTIEREIPWDELEERLRETTLLEPRDGEPVLPYTDATIRLEELSFEDVSPTTLYVIRKNLSFQESLASVLAEAGHHPLDLHGGLVLRAEDGTETGLTPPIVEETDEEGRYILDGGHRTFKGWQLGRTTFIGAHVSGIRPDCPPYAYPNRWNEVRIVDDVPVNPADKKRYREGNYRALYRDFGALNGSRLRETSS